MKQSLALLFLVLIASVHGSEKPPILVQNPKLLVPPIMLTRADTYLDLDGRLSGTLTDSRGQQFQFMLHGGLGVRSDPTNRYLDYPKANFDGWQLDDFASMLEEAIRRQFTWDTTGDRLHPKSPDEFEDSKEADRFTAIAAKRLLRWAEHQLNRKTSYMQ